MRVQVGGVRLFFDVDGAKLVPDGPWMRERPTVACSIRGLGSTTVSSRCRSALARGGDAGHLSRHARIRPQRRRPARGAPARALGRRRARIVRGAADRAPVVLGIGFGSLVALQYATRHPSHPAALVLGAPVARIVPERSIASTSGSVERRRAKSRSATTTRWTSRPSRTSSELLPAALDLPVHSDVIARADWNPEVLIRWMAGEAKVVDLRGRLGAIETPTLVLAGEDDAWAPLELVREAADLLAGPTRFRSFPGARHSAFRDAPEAYEELRLSSTTSSRERASREGRPSGESISSSTSTARRSGRTGRGCATGRRSSSSIRARRRHSPYKEHIGPALTEVAQVVYLDLRVQAGATGARPSTGQSRPGSTTSKPSSTRSSSSGRCCSGRPRVV